jgi:hypothetical protein
MRRSKLLGHQTDGDPAGAPAFTAVRVVATHRPSGPTGSGGRCQAATRCPAAVVSG